jgi:hypothetical protein
MELFAEYRELGMEAGTAFGADQAHPGRLSFEDVEGQPQSLLGADFLGMLYESVDGTRMLDISTQNTATTPYGVYGFEGDDHLTLFVMGNDQTGEVELNIEGLGSEYTMIWAESLTAVVPENWQAQYGVPLSPGVDQTPEGLTYADGQRGAVEVTVNANGLSFDVTEPGQVVRLVLARTPEGEEAVQNWIGPQASVLDLLEDTDVDPGPEPDPYPYPDTDPDPDTPLDPDTDPDPDTPPDESEQSILSDGGGFGGLLFLLVPLLALAGMG